MVKKKRPGQKPEEKYSCAQVIETLRLTKGMVYVAADRLQCTPQTVYNYIERHPSIKEAWEAESGKMLDIGELKLYDRVVAGEGWAVCFLLKTKGKARGYVEKSELKIEDGLQVHVTLSGPEGSE